MLALCRSGLQPDNFSHAIIPAISTWRNNKVLDAIALHQGKWHASRNYQLNSYYLEKLNAKDPK